jgi:hypothetical protein
MREFDQAEELCELGRRGDRGMVDRNHVSGTRPLSEGLVSVVLTATSSRRFKEETPPGADGVSSAATRERQATTTCLTSAI